MTRGIVERPEPFSLSVRGHLDMNLEQLRSALKQALATGRAGQPVALRLHLQTGTAAATTEQLLACLMPVVSDVFGDEPQRVLARSATDSGQLNLLLEYEQGATVLVSVVALGQSRPCLHVILIGNHGVIRLEGGEDFALAEPLPDGHHLLQRVQQSLECGEPAGH